MTREFLYWEPKWQTRGFHVYEAQEGKYGLRYKLVVWVRDETDEFWGKVLYANRDGTWRWEDWDYKKFPKTLFTDEIKMVNGRISVQMNYSMLKDRNSELEAENIDLRARVEAGKILIDQHLDEMAVFKAKYNEVEELVCEIATESLTDENPMTRVMAKQLLKVFGRSVKTDEENAEGQ